jgi:hypothetical protein
VTMIDADPNRPLSQWAIRPGKPDKLTVIATTTEASIIDTIEKAALQTTFVIVDLEGTASLMAGYAMSRADLVIIPTQGSNLDATEAVPKANSVSSTPIVYHPERRIDGKSIAGYIRSADQGAAMTTTLSGPQAAVRQPILCRRGQPGNQRKERCSRRRLPVREPPCKSGGHRPV